ncbi:MAG: hypothetical protein ACREUX_20830 [Burkholderiales bacterium]
MKTPAAIIARLNQEVVHVLQTPEMKQRFLNSGVETVGSSPEEFTATIKAEATRLAQIFKKVGVRSGK